jgi:DNA helicase-2/ATP-dependent DNA helicase PcrA
MVLATALSNLITQNLNDQQLQAVNHVHGPLLVAAGAGAGKTGVLTRRIAKMFVQEDLDPGSFLVSTFTVKAANEMTERLVALLSDLLSLKRHDQLWDHIRVEDQQAITREVRQDFIKPMLIGTLHKCFGQILRSHIESYKDPAGLQWTNRYKILDPTDQQRVYREIITKKLNLDVKIFNPRSIAASISKFKNCNVMPGDMNIPDGQQGRMRRVIQNIYTMYRQDLAADNALDFDDMLMIAARLLYQNKEIRQYWHNRYRHILVDEYQDTNQCQFDVLRMITAGNAATKDQVDWTNRSFFVVGDVDQAIYSFRGADYQIMLNFQQDFGDGILSKESKTMILLEKNYRSTDTIIQAANHLIKNNTQRVDKILESTRGKGDPIKFKSFADEDREAEYIADKVKELVESGKHKYSDIAVLYRNNSISRCLESEFVSRNIPHILLKGVRFFERKEIKDVLSYLQFLDDQTSDAALMRIMAVPKRGIGPSTIEKLKLFAYERDLVLWDVLKSESQLKECLGRKNKGLLAFIELITDFIVFKEENTLLDLARYVVEKIDYIEYLNVSAQNPDEATERKSNVYELFNAIKDHTEQTGDQSIVAFLEAVSLQLESGKHNENNNATTLMTIHSSKGLEYPVVFLAAAEDDIIPSYRAIQNEDMDLIEEERRLFYVAMTRAKDDLTISAVRTRTNAYGDAFSKSPSMFLQEIPDQYMMGDTDRL